MKLHDLKPAPGSRKAKRRVGRGIAAGQGKTAGRGTKGQKARAGGSIPAWFEGGQTPLHQRIPKLRGFKNPFKVHYEVVNLGDIARLVELGELEAGDMPGSKAKKGATAPITVNQEILRAAGLVRRLDRPMKVLGAGGDALSAALFVVADKFSASARSTIEAAGGTVSVLEVPDAKRPALGTDAEAATNAKAGGDAASDDASPETAESEEAEADSAEAKPAKAAAAKSVAPKAAAAKKSAPKAAAPKPAAEKPAAKAKAAPAKAKAAPAKAGAPAKASTTRKPRASKPDADA
jgi:large subunit ribosomal protein L15